MPKTCLAKAWLNGLLRRHLDVFITSIRRMNRMPLQVSVGLDNSVAPAFSGTKRAMKIKNHGNGIDARVLYPCLPCAYEPELST